MNLAEPKPSSIVAHALCVNCDLWITKGLRHPAEQWVHHLSGDRACAPPIKG